MICLILAACTCLKPLFLFGRIDLHLLIVLRAMGAFFCIVYLLFCLVNKEELWKQCKLPPCYQNQAQTFPTNHVRFFLLTFVSGSPF